MRSGRSFGNSYLTLDFDRATAATRPTTRRHDPNRHHEPISARPAEVFSRGRSMQ